MKAVVVLEPSRPSKVVCVNDAPMPVLDDYECLVRVKACGICSNTDLRIAFGEHPDVPGFTFRYPAILGHEASGEIVELGKKVRYLKIGDRVVCPTGGLGSPQDKYGTSYGAMSEYNKALDYRAIKEDGKESVVSREAAEEQDFLTKVFPSDISFVDATLLLSFKENYSALRNFGAKEGMDILIYGDGANCMGLSLFARAYKARQVVVIGHHDERLAKIKAVSKVDLLINSHRENPAELLKDRKFDLVIDAVGNIEIAKQGTRFLKPGGTFSIFGVLPKGKSTIDLYDIPNYRGIQILSYPYHEHRTHDEIIGFIQSGFVKASDFYSHVMPAEQAGEAFHLLENREAFKVILTF